MKKKKLKPVKKTKKFSESKYADDDFANMPGVTLPIRSGENGKGNESDNEARERKFNFIASFAISAVLIGAYSAWWIYNTGSQDSTHFAHEAGKLTAKGSQSLLTVTALVSLLCALVGGLLGGLNYLLLHRLRLNRKGRKVSKKRL